MPDAIGIDIGDEYDGKKGCPDAIMDFTNLTFDSNTFGNVCLLDTLEHVDDPQAVIDEAHRVLQPNGILAIIDPSDSVLFWTRLLALRFAAAFKGNPDHKWHFNRAKLEALTQGKFVLEKYIPYGISTGYRFRSAKDAIVIDTGNIEHWTYIMFKSFVLTFLIYWGVRAPMQWFMTVYLGMWWQLSSFVAGVILTIASFFVSYRFVWGRK